MDIDYLKSLETLRPNQDEALKAAYLKYLKTPVQEPMIGSPMDIYTGTKEMAKKGKSTWGKIGMGTIGALLGAASSLRDPNVLGLTISSTQGDPYGKLGGWDYANRQGAKQDALKADYKQSEGNKMQSIGEHVRDAEKGQREFDLKIADLIKDMVKKSEEGQKNPGGISKEEWDRGLGIRDRFVKENNAFKDVRDSYARLTAASKEPSAAGDLAIIFNYMKMLDPGSTVREGEFANAQNAAGIPERVSAMYNRAITGERLTPETRADFIQQSHGQYKSMEDNYKKSMKEFKKLAQSTGLNPDQFLWDISQEDKTQATQTIQQEGTLMVDKNGNKAIVYSDGTFKEMQ